MFFVVVTHAPTGRKTAGVAGLTCAWGARLGADPADAGREASAMAHQVVAFVLAGGRGNRLLPLTRARAKPAVPFGGKYRIIDFVLSNLINSGVYAIYVLVQFQSQSLLRHLRDGWQFGGLLREQFIIRNRSGSENFTLAMPSPYGILCRHGNTGGPTPRHLGMHTTRSPSLYWGA
jgi:nucleotidyltransferase-like protein